MSTARYDGQTEWYESFASGAALAAMRACAVRLLGAGPGRCLDLGCGTGLAFAPLHAAGWSVVGVDVSADQLEVARARAPEDVVLVEADAHALPFEDGEFDGVLSVLTHTDLDDPARVLAEADRVLRPGGSFVYAGVHPCFGSPFVAKDDDGIPVAVRPGYLDARWHHLPPDPDSARVRARVGINHVPLAGLLNAIAGAGLSIKHVEEPGSTDPPLFIAIRAVAGF